MISSPEKTINALKANGYQVERLTPYQYRVESVFDLYIIRFRWHNIANGERGGWRGTSVEGLQKLIDRHVAIADAILDREIAAGHVIEEPVNQGPYVRGKDVDSKIWWTKPGLEKSRSKTN